MIAEMKAANALGARTARACDSCLRRRARWFCAADDAFLCQGCDNLVHSANQLASRHERVRLHTASSELNSSVTPQAWHSGFTRKARTPRHNKHLLVKQERISKDEEEFFNTLLVVPDLGNNEEPVFDETEEQLLYRVPVFDPFDILETTMKPDVGDDVEETHDLDNFSEILPSDVDLAEFVADVENLLGSAGLDEDSGEMKGQELFDCKEDEDKRSMKVKDEQLEADTAFHLEPVLGITRQEEEEKLVVPVAANDSVSENKMFLRLNYEEVISAWDSQGCPWTTGNPPHFNSHDCLGSSGGDIGCYYGDVGSLRGGIVDGGREARVSRYREKRRTRLFAKKIRYEVRKLNAEKRPRMKGRFVKRTSFVEATSFPAYH